MAKTPAPPTGTVTFLFTDIEGSTRLWERDPALMAAALSDHDRLLCEAVAAHRGHVVKTTGDGILAAFDAATDALAAALAGQRALLAALAPDRADGLRLRARMGLHSGVAELRDGDYHGPSLNRAARIMSIGHGGQVLVSAATAELVADSLPPGAALRPLGSFRLRGIARPESVYQLLADGLPQAFPPLRTASSRLVNLPQPPTGFVGRWPEVEEILALLLAHGARLVTLIGPGGMGKTRLSIQAATTLLERDPLVFPDGVFFVSLAPLQTAAAITTAVAAAIGFHFSDTERTPRDQLIDYLRGRNALIILDNMEHLLDDGGALWPADVLAAAPAVRILSTSRARLAIQGEQLYVVPAMSLPAPEVVRAWAAGEAGLAAAGDYSALRLFQEAAARSQPGFRLGRDNVAVVAHIAHQVQGMPLGIELAAGWLELLSPEEIAAEIERSLDVLATDLHGVPERQRSLRAVFDSSWALASARERALLPPLAIFRAPFEREAAEAVAGARLPDLLALTNRSWLQRVAVSDGISRFQMHELLRQLAAEKLRADADTEAAARDRFMRHYAALVVAIRPRLYGREQREALARIESEYAHLHLAWEWLVAAGEYTLLVEGMLPVLHRFAHMRGARQQAGDLVQMALDGCRGAGADCGEHHRAILLLAAASLLYAGSDPDLLLHEASDILDRLNDPEKLLGATYPHLLHTRRYSDPQAVERLQALTASADPEVAVAAMHNLGLTLASDAGNPAALAAAPGWLQRAGTAFRQRGDDWACATICAHLAEAEARLNELDAALAHIDEAQSLFESVADWQNAAILHRFRADIALQRGQPDLALAALADLLANSRERGDRMTEIFSLGFLGMTLVRYGDVNESLRLRREALAASRDIGFTANVPWNLWEMGEAYRLAGSPAEARASYDEARAMFQAQHHDFGLGYCERGYGDLALMAGDPTAAAGHFAAAQRLIGQYPDQAWSFVYVSNGLARAHSGLGQPVAALAQLVAALPVANNFRLTEMQTLLLATVAELALAAGRARLAAALCALLAGHPLTWNETRARVAALAAAAAGILSEAGSAAVPACVLDVVALSGALATLPAGDPDEWLGHAESLALPPASAAGATSP